MDLIKTIAILLALVLARATVAMGQNENSELHGNFRHSFAYADAGNATHWTSANNASRLGVRGDVSGRSLTAFFDLQPARISMPRKSAARSNQRYYFAGVRGGFGAVTIGRQSTAYKMPAWGWIPSTTPLR